MKALMRGFGLLLLGVIILGLSGCNADNETDAAKLSKTGTPPAGGGGQASVQKPISNMDEYAKQNPGKNSYQGTALDKKK